MLTKITNIDSFDKLLDSKEFFFFLKHSNTCPISAGAFEDAVSGTAATDTKKWISIYNL